MTIDAATVAAACEVACQRYGQGFAQVLAGSSVWVNGEPAEADAALADGDEVAILPPVSGGAS